MLSAEGVAGRTETGRGVATTREVFEEFGSTMKDGETANGGQEKSNQNSP